jgi:putative ABC transport system permease protein
MKSQSTKLAIRNLLKHKSFTFISLAGLATSLAASIVVLTYYFHEISFDKHIPDSERTYRIVTRFGEGNLWARTFACYGDALEKSPQVEKYTSFMHITNGLVNIGETDFTVSETVIADTGFIDFFGLELISGRKEDLGLPNHLFITEELAETFFPGVNPMGREIFLRNFEGAINDSLGHYLIAGIIKPLPDNTHFGCDMVVSQKGHYSERLKHLKEAKLFGANVYVRLFPNVPASELEMKLTEAVVPFLEGKPGPPLEAFNSSLQPVRDIHFTTDIHREPRPVTRKSMIYILLSVGLLILALMTLNFSSMVIVQSHEQGKTTRIMRIMGANKTDLFRLSLYKIALLVVLSLLLTWIIIALSEPFLQTILGPGWSFQSLSKQIFSVGLGAGLLVILFTALGTHLSVPGRKSFNSFGLLTVVQFAIVIILVAFSMMINRQIRFLDHKDLGYSEENILVNRIPAANPRGSLLVEEIQKQAGVISATTAQYHPGDVFQSMDFSAGGQTYQFGFRMVDDGFFETLDINLVERFGSPFGELKGWVINESFYNELLLDFSPEDVAASNFSLANENQDDSRGKFEICGVMEDFHFSSLHNRIGNFAFVIQNQETHYNRWLMVRFIEGHSEDVLKAVGQMMDTHFPGKSYDQFLLEDNLAEQYKASYNLSKVIRLFALLSVLIAMSGLYGLSLYMTRKRTKEIGIRKIHGSSTRQIIVMLNLGFQKWVWIAFALAFPVTIWALNKWLTNFAYRTSMPWWIFALSGITIALIAMIAVTWQTSKAARLNPVDTIQSE